MRPLRITLLALTLILAAYPAAALANTLDVAWTYNTFVFNDYDVLNSDSQGPVAAGGNAYFQSYSINSAYPTSSSGDGLVVGGNLEARDGTIYGNARIGGTAALTRVDIQNGSLSTNAALPVDFDAAEARLKSLSTSLSSAQTGGGLTVFNLNGGAPLSNLNGLNLGGVNPGDTIIVNVSGASSGLTNMSMESLAPYNGHILFNFYEATTLTLTSIGIKGSILAPFADVTANWGNIDGTIIASSFTGTLEQHYVPFTGELPTPIPGAAWLLGTGLLGLLAFRRRR